MSSLRYPVAIASLLSVANGKQWTLNTKTSAAVLVGVGAGSDTVASAAAGDNNVGAYVETLTSSGWIKTVVGMGMLLDSAATPSGNSVGTSIWGVIYSTDNGKTFTTVDGVSGASQSANTWGPNKEYFGLVGNWVLANPDGTKPVTVGGVAYSKDAGESWSVSANVPAGAVRYGAFPSENTWYVSSGMWGNDPVVKGVHSLSSRVHVNKKGAFSFPEPNNNKRSASNDTLPTGWFGTVSKTTDGGNSWTEVFSTDKQADYLYFNGIACSSDSHCVVVAEGDTPEGGYLTQAYVTFDAGATWAATLTTSDVGLMQAKWVNDLEGWVVGTAKSGRNINGQFYHTVDGGKTWELAQSLPNCFAIDFDFAQTTGFAACSSSSGSSASIAEYI